MSPRKMNRRRRAPRPLWTVLLAVPALAADPTNGPLAGMSIRSEVAYQTARACAAKCVAYKGDFGCNNAGFYDVAAYLGCNKCDTINGCCAFPFSSTLPFSPLTDDDEKTAPPPSPPQQHSTSPAASAPAVPAPSPIGKLR